MRGRITEKSSILLLSRNTVIIGALVITVLGLGLGYLLGYKGGTLGIAEKQQGPTETKLPLPPEEKKVIESPSGDSPVFPAAPKTEPQASEQQAQKETEQPAAKDIQQPQHKKTQERGIKPAQKDAEPKEKKTAQEVLEPEKKQEVPPEKQAAKTHKEKRALKKSSEAQREEVKQPAAPAKTEKTQAKPGPAAKKIYTIQFGAFPSSEGASQLAQFLKTKNINAYITERVEGDPYYRVRAGSYKNRKEAEKAALSLQKQTGLPNFVAAKH
ncbi:MAG: SPOR domain-containing protein [Nitrospirae bacterium]|nr:MAG: SPOR domain-containing protein [Nitrospirota bacterium]